MTPGNETVGLIGLHIVLLLLVTSRYFSLVLVFVNANTP